MNFLCCHFFVCSNKKGVDCQQRMDNMIISFNNFMSLISGLMPYNVFGLGEGGDFHHKG